MSFVQRSQRTVERTFAPSRTELADALGAGEIRIDLQPQLNLGSGRVVAVEALARWTHPELGPVPPLTFIPIAEQHGLGEAVAATVLDQALACVRQLDALGAQALGVAVNVSARSLGDDGRVHRVREALARSGVAPSRLTLEVTEDALSGDPAGLQEVLSRLKSLGVRLSLDDFGSGYSSLGRLQTLPLDELKIDRVFVEQMRRCRDTGVIAAIAALGRHLGMTVVAEGPESTAELELLAGLGCHLAQGYAVSAPLPPAQFYDWLGQQLARPPTVRARPAACAALQPARPDESAELGLRLHHALDQTMTDAGAIEVVCHATTARLARELGADFAAWWRTGSERELDSSLRCVTAWSAQPGATAELTRATRAMTFAAGVGLPGRALEEREPVWVADVEAEPGLPRAGALRAAGMRSALAIPIRTRDRTVGVLEFFGAQLRQPDRRGMTALSSIGVRLAHFLARRDAIAASDGYRATFDVLHAVFAALAVAAPDQVPAQLCQHTARLARADVVGLWLPGEAPGELRLAASHGGLDPRLRTNALDEHSAVATAHASQERLFFGDLAAHPLPSRRLAQVFRARSALLQPVVGDGIASAVISIAWSTPRERVEEPLLTAVGLLADYARPLLR